MGRSQGESVVANAIHNGGRGANGAVEGAVVLGRATGIWVAEATELLGTDFNRVTNTNFNQRQVGYEHQMLH